MSEGRSSRSSSLSSSDRKCSFGQCIIPFIVLLSFFLNFVYSDVGGTADKYDTLLTPPHPFFLIWLVIYVLEFIFVIYQLFKAKARNSNLVQRKIALPFIAHQVLTATWLVLFSREKIYEATGILTAIWLLALLIFGLVARESRTFRYKHYSTADFCCIEIPFAFLFGWETVALLISWYVFIVKLLADGYITKSTAVTAQIAYVTIAFAVICSAAILFAGLPRLMDPFIHLPIMWGLAGIAYRWLKGDVDASSSSLADHLDWTTLESRKAYGYTACIVFCVVAAFFLVAAAILGSSRLCSQKEDSSMIDQAIDSAHSSNIILGANNEEATRMHRSPRTARSALSTDRV